MGDLLHLRDAHEQAQMLLPWHVNGTLEPAEAAWFEAHLGECAECQTDVAADRKLRNHVASLPIGTEPASAPLFDRVAATSGRHGQVPERFFRRRIRLGWAIAGQAAAAAAVAAFMVLSPAQQDSGYDLLGSPPGPASGNAIVLFSPDARWLALWRSPWRWSFRRWRDPNRRRLNRLLTLPKSPQAAKSW